MPGDTNLGRVKMGVVVILDRQKNKKRRANKYMITSRYIMHREEGNAFIERIFLRIFFALFINNT